MPSTYKYIFKAAFIIAPSALLLWLFGGSIITFIAWMTTMCFVELLEINDKLKQPKNDRLGPQ